MSLNSVAGSRPEVGSSRNRTEGLGEELDGDADPLALAAGEIGNAGARALAKAKLGHGLEDEFEKFEPRGSAWKTEACGEVEGLGDSQLGMDDFRLGDEAPVVGAAAGGDRDAIDGYECRR